MIDNGNVDDEEDGVFMNYLHFFKTYTFLAM